MSNLDFLLVLNTCPDVDVAQDLAHDLVATGQAACVNIVPTVRSIYLWQGAVQSRGRGAAADQDDG